MEKKQKKEVITWWAWRVSQVMWESELSVEQQVEALDLARRKVLGEVEFKVTFRTGKGLTTTLASR